MTMKIYLSINNVIKSNQKYIFAFYITLSWLHKKIFYILWRPKGTEYQAWPSYKVQFWRFFFKLYNTQWQVCIMQFWKESEWQDKKWQLPFLFFIQMRKQASIELFTIRSIVCIYKIHPTHLESLDPGQSLEDEDWRGDPPFFFSSDLASEPSTWKKIHNPALILDKLHCIYYQQVNL